MSIPYAFPRFKLLQQDYNFQHNGALPHYTSQVSDCLNSKRLKNWIGRGGPAARPPRSPCLTPCVFFLWGHIKSKIYSTAIDSMKESKRRITAEVRGIGEEVLIKTLDNTKFRFNFVKKVKDGHIESMLD